MTLSTSPRRHQASHGAERPIGLATLTMCALLAGCSLTHVEARPAPSMAHVSIMGIESDFTMPPEVKQRLSESLASSLGERGHMLAGPADASCNIVATVEREIHRASVSGSMHSVTDYDYGTYRVQLIALDLGGNQIGEAHTQRDVFLEDMKVPAREEKLLVEGIRRASNALFQASAAVGSRVASSSR